MTDQQIDPRAAQGQGRQRWRAHSVTVNGFVRTKHSGGGNTTFVSEVSEQTKRRDHEIHLDYGKRVCTIVHIESGNRTDVPFESCNSWNPYSDEEIAALEEAELETATAPRAGNDNAKRKGAAA